jgi:hypothetical protein
MGALSLQSPSFAFYSSRKATVVLLLGNKNPDLLFFFCCVRFQKVENNPPTEVLLPSKEKFGKLHVAPRPLLPISFKKKKKKVTESNKITVPP